MEDTVKKIKSFEIFHPRFCKEMVFENKNTSRVLVSTQLNKAFQSLILKINYSDVYPIMCSIGRT